MTNLEAWIEKRDELARHYFEALAPKHLPRYFSEERRSVFHLYVNHIAPEQRSVFFRKLCEQGIGANVHYLPIYKQPWYQHEQPRSLPQAEQFYCGAITRPLFPDLSATQQDLIHAHLLSTT